MPLRRLGLKRPRLYPRWWVFKSLAATFAMLDSDIYWSRFGSLLAHLATGAVFPDSSFISVDEVVI